MSTGKAGPYVFVASVIVGCLVLGVALVVFAKDVPALVVSVVLACAVAALLYGILGGVSDSGFNLGPVKMGCSAAVLLGCVWLFNQSLGPQLDKIRGEARLDRLGFDFDEHADPPDGWFAIESSSGVPIEVAFTDPVAGEVEETVKPPGSASLPLTLAGEAGGESYVVLGTGAEPEQGLGYMRLDDILSVVGAAGDLKPGTVHGPKRLHLTNRSELPADASREWGTSGPCRGKYLPMLIRVVRFHDGFADYDLTRCDTADPNTVDHSSSLASGDGELLELTIEGVRRHFVITVVAADHEKEPFWSSFLVIEME